MHRWCSIGADVQMCIVAGAGGEVQLCRGAGVGSGVGAVPRCRCRGAEVQRRCRDLQVFRDSEVKVQGAMELRCSLGAKAQQS